MKMESQPVSITSNSGAHIRSRITVVCAECKRLKLKCDRRTPCSSCIKRDTVPRCLYSAAAAEKIDVQSLHNRVLTLESQIAQLASQSFTSGGPRTGIPHSRSFLNDRNVVAAGASGSSIIISLDDVSGIWLDALELNDINERIVLTPQPPALPAGATSPHVFTDLDFSKFRIPPTFSEPGGSLGVTPALVHLLPQNLALRDEMLKQLETTLELHPSVNFPHFKGRILDLYKFAAAAGGKASGFGPSASRNVHSRGRSASTSVAAAAEAEELDSRRPSTSTGLPIPRPSLSFFSAAAAAFALAARILGSTNQGMAGTGTGQASTSGSGRDFSPSGLPPHSNLGPQTSSQQQQQQTTFNGSSANNPSPPVHSPLAPGTNSTVPSPPIPSGSGVGVGVGGPPGSGRASHSHTHASPSAQSQTHSRTSPTPISPSQHHHQQQHHGQQFPVSPSALFTLSLHSLTMHELSGAYDLDYLVALLLQVLFLLYDNGGLKNPSVPQILFPMVGKMVNVARMMGLWVDPSEVGTGSPGQGSRYGLFESEMRRRIWWDIYFYDLFVSDAMGQPPLIQDDFATCNLPADTNEDVFSPVSVSLPPPIESAKNFSYFSLKCRLAQLVKGMKKRTFRDPFRNVASPLEPNNGDLSIDSAIAFESEVATWIAEIPPMFRLNMLEEDVNLLVQSANPVLVAQQCEIMTITARLVIKIFVPFLRRAKHIGGTQQQQQQGNAIGGGKTPHHAVHACVNAAHTIIHASKVAHTLYKQRSYSIRAESLFYSFGRQIFDAAVISAHSVITSPQSLFAKVAMEDLKVAVEIMRDPVACTSAASPFHVTLEGAPGEALKIVELLQAKAEAARSGAGAPVLGMKRKHSEVEESLRPGFQLPYVGGGVFTSFSANVGVADDATVISNGTDAGRTKFERRENHVGRDRSQKVGYPPIGVRVRTDSSKSTDSAARGHVNEALNHVKSKSKGKQVQQSAPNIQSPVNSISQNGMAPPSGPSDPPSFSPPPPTAPAIASQPIQPQGDFGQMVSPEGSYRPEEEAMMHYSNSQATPEDLSYPPPPPSHGMPPHGMYDYGGSNSPQIHSGAGPPTSGNFYVSPTSTYSNSGPAYPQPPIPSHSHAHLGMPPPMLALATHQAPNAPPQLDPSTPGPHSQRDTRYQPPSDNRPDPGGGVEPMPPMQYEVPTPTVPATPNGWMDGGGRYQPHQGPGPAWSTQYGYWKTGPP